MITPGNGGNGGDGGHGGVAGAIVAASIAGNQLQVATLVHVTATNNGGGGAGGQPGGKGKAGSAAAGTVAGAGADGADGKAGEDGGGSVAIANRWKSVASVIATGNAADRPDCWAPASASTLSVATDNTCNFGAAGTQAFDALALGELASNGGPTQTRLPAATSSLVDKVPAAQPPLTVDQRGVTRPQAAGSEIGAVETQLIELEVTKTASASSVVAGTKVAFTITARNTGTSTPKPGVTVEDPKCTGLSTASGDTDTDGALDPGETFSYTCSATPTEAGKFTNTATIKVIDGAGNPITGSASVDVTVTAPAGTPPAPTQPAGLPATGPPDLVPTLLGGLALIVAGTVLMLAGRPRRRRVVVRAR